MIHQDWEHEALRDFIYLQEELMLLRQEILEEEMIRKPANIIIIDEDKLHKNEHKPKLLTVPEDPQQWI